MRVFMRLNASMDACVCLGVCFDVDFLIFVVVFLIGSFALSIPGLWFT